MAQESACLSVSISVFKDVSDFVGRDLYLYKYSIYGYILLLKCAFFVPMIGTENTVGKVNMCLTHCTA